MKRKALQILLAMVYISSIMAAQTMPVSAKVVKTETVTAPGKSQTTVTYSQGDDFSVSIPKLVVLEKTKKASYEVSVHGDISGKSLITVKPDESFKMKDTSGVKPDVDAVVEQDGTDWTYSNLSEVRTGTITAEKLSAGEWKGNFNFNIEADKI